MTYHRDRDAYTRGSGAIAAADFGNQRRAAERRYRLARSAARDAQLAGLTYGERGGLGGTRTKDIPVGGSSRTPQVRPERSKDLVYQGLPGRPDLKKPPTTYGTPTGTTSGKPIPGGGRVTGGAAVIAPVTAIDDSYLYAKDGNAIGTGTKTSPSTGGGGLNLPPAPVTNPAIPAAATPAKKKAAIAAVSSPGGGGGGTWSPPTSPGIVVATPGVVTMPVVDEIPDAAPTKRPWWLIIAAVGAAYLILRNEDE